MCVWVGIAHGQPQCTKTNKRWYENLDILCGWFIIKPFQNTNAFSYFYISSFLHFFHVWKEKNEDNGAWTIVKENFIIRRVDENKLKGLKSGIGEKKCL